MDWELSIERYRADLIRAVGWLFTWLKLEVGGSLETLPRHQRRTILFVLRPAESALRRLILIGARVWKTTAPRLRERVAPSNRKERKRVAVRRERAVPPSFKLIDPRKQFDLNPNKPKFAKGPGPWVTDFWSDDPIYDRSALYAYQQRMNRAPEECPSAEALFRRMNAVMAALEDLPTQARRLVALQARLKRRRERTGQPDLAPLRPGAPPGSRRRHKHEVDAVLADCHLIALMALREMPDTS